MHIGPLQDTVNLEDAMENSAKFPSKKCPKVGYSLGSYFLFSWPHFQEWICNVGFVVPLLLITLSVCLKLEKKVFYGSFFLLVAFALLFCLLLYRLEDDKGRNESLLLTLLQRSGVPDFTTEIRSITFESQKLMKPVLKVFESTTLKI